MRWALAILLAAVATPALASPPPAPPQYLHDAALVLTALPVPDDPAYSRLFADDVTAVENGKVVASGKQAWLALPGTRPGLILAFNDGAGDNSGGVALLIVDSYNAATKFNDPPRFLADPRIVARATLYEFGSDRLIHGVQISKAPGTLIRPTGAPLSANR